MPRFLKSLTGHIPKSRRRRVSAKSAEVSFAAVQPAEPRTLLSGLAPGSSEATAAEIPVGDDFSTGGQRMLFVNSNYRGYYTFEVTRRTTVRMDYDGQSRHAVRIYSPERGTTQLTEDTGPTGSGFEAAATLAPGRYVISLFFPRRYGTSPQSAYSFSLRFNEAAFDNPDEGEPGGEDNNALATSRIYPGKVRERNAVEGGDTVDYFRFAVTDFDRELRSGRAATILSVQVAGYTGELDLQLLDQNGDPMPQATRTIRSGRQVAYTILDNKPGDDGPTRGTGVYGLRVSAVGDTESEYTVFARFASNPAIDIPDAAKPKYLGVNPTQTLGLTEAASSGRYLRVPLSLTNASRFTARISGIPREDAADVDIWLFRNDSGRNGERVGSAETLGPPSPFVSLVRTRQLRVSGLENGEYWLVVSTLRGFGARVVTNV